MAGINKGNFKYRTKEQQFEMAAKRSYNSYIKNRQRLLDQGYSLEKQISFDEYSQYMKMAKQAKLPFNGRLLARYDKSFGIKESRQIAKKLKTKGIEITDQEIRQFNMNQRTKEEEFQESTRAAFFQHLLSMGLDYEEAEKVMY